MYRWWSGTWVGSEPGRQWNDQNHSQATHALTTIVTLYKKCIGLILWTLESRRALPVPEGDDDQEYRRLNCVLLDLHPCSISLVPVPELGPGRVRRRPRPPPPFPETWNWREIRVTYYSSLWTAVSSWRAASLWPRQTSRRRREWSGRRSGPRPSPGGASVAASPASYRKYIFQFSIFLMLVRIVKRKTFFH